MDKIISGIYCIENKINGKKYIGKAIDIYKRWKQHRDCLNKKSKHENTHFINAWHKYGENNFEFSILEKCDVNKLDDREKYWISFYNSRKNGYNKTNGGSGGNTRINYSGQKLEEHKKKVHEARLKSALRGEEVHTSVLTKEDVLKIIERFINGDSDKNISKDYNVTLSTISAIRKHKTWKELTQGLDFENSKGKINKDYLKSVDMYTKNGVLIKSYSSLYDIKKEYPLYNLFFIYKVCCGKAKSYKEHIWRFSDCLFDQYPIYNKNIIPINQYDLNWNFIKTYESIAEANKCLGITNIGDCLRTHKKEAGGYHWITHDKKPPVNINYSTIRQDLCKPVDQYDDKWNLICEYFSVTQASQKTQIPRTSISNGLHTNKLIHGYYWSYHNDNILKD